MNDQEFVDQAMAFINDDCDYLADHERMSKEDERKLMQYEQREFIALIAEMRILQKEYFKSRDKSILSKCVRIEKQVRNHLLSHPENSNQHIFILVSSMMDLQRDYFQSRTIDILRKSKVAEVALDKFLQDFQPKSKQTSLF